jgi:hypothetical protein
MIQKHTLPNEKAAIYGETANINYFLKTALEADVDDGVINTQSTVKQHTRRRYKGDNTPASVSGHNRVSMYDAGRRNGAATPGKNMLLSDGTERRAFTYTGPWTEVHAFLVGDAKMDLMAYSQSARYDIKAVPDG